MFIEKEAYYPGPVASEFKSKEMKESDVQNADETYFSVNVNNQPSLGFEGDKEVKHVYMVSGCGGRTKMVQISSVRDGCIEAPFMLFHDQSRSCTIRGVPKDVAVVSYWSGPKGWIDRKVLCLCLTEPRVINPLPNNNKRILSVDNRNWLGNTEQLQKALKMANTELRFLCKNVTHFVQERISFIIQKVKQAWTRRWQDEKMRLIKEGLCSDLC